MLNTVIMYVFLNADPNDDPLFLTFNSAALALSFSLLVSMLRSRAEQQKTERRLDWIEDALRKIGKHLGVPNLDPDKHC